MQLYPTRTAAHVAIAATVVTAVGIAARQPALVGWGGAMLFAVAVARAATLVSVARIRAAGFEMLWTGTKRVVRAARGSTIVLAAEVRNRDTLAARYVRLRAVASSQISVTIEPAEGEVAAAGRLEVNVVVRCPRVGRHGIHGLALEVHGASGLFEVPLTFANPYGIEVVPRPFATFLMQPRGGRSRLLAAAGKAGRSRGEGNELRELRDHYPGDPFRRIAWKATARRGKLLVREYEREERDVVWIVVCAPVELWSGPVGAAPLDLAIDEASAIATRYLARGDRVGLFVVAQGLRVHLPPAQGPTQGAKIAHALGVGAGTYDADRSDLDENDVAMRVLEHLRPLDSKGLGDVRRGDLDKLAARADAARSRAPFQVRAPQGRSLRDRTLRRYLASFGIDSPAKLAQAKDESSGALVDALGQIAREKPRASLVHIVAPPPDETEIARVGDAVRKVSRGGVQVSWSVPPVLPSLEGGVESVAQVKGEEEPLLPKRREAWRELVPITREAVAMRVMTQQTRREAALRKYGVRVVRTKHVAPARESETATPTPTQGEGY